jgi:hypothetical protein
VAVEDSHEGRSYAKARALANLSYFSFSYIARKQSSGSYASLMSQDLSSIAKVALHLQCHSPIGYPKAPSMTDHESVGSCITTHEAPRHMFRVRAFMPQAQPRLWKLHTEHDQYVTVWQPLYGQKQVGPGQNHRQMKRCDQDRWSWLPLRPIRRRTRPL